MRTNIKNNPKLVEAALKAFKHYYNLERKDIGYLERTGSELYALESKLGGSLGSLALVGGSEAEGYTLKELVQVVNAYCNNEEVYIARRGNGQVVYLSKHPRKEGRKVVLD